MKKFVGVVVMVLGLVLLAPGAVSAVPPLGDVTEVVTDQAGVLDVVVVQESLERASAESGYGIRVVFVESFDGLDGATWAKETAQTSGLDPYNDVLFAVATQDRLFGSAYPQGRVVADKIGAIEAQIVPYLKSGNWTEAAKAYGNSVLHQTKDPNRFAHAPVVKSDGGVSTSGGANDDVKWFLLFFGIVIVVVGVGVSASTWAPLLWKPVARRRARAAKIKEAPGIVAAFGDKVKVFEDEYRQMCSDFPAVASDEELRQGVSVLTEDLNALRRVTRELESNGNSSEAYEKALSTVSSVRKHEDFILRTRENFEGLRERAASASSTMHLLFEEVDAFEQALNGAAEHIERGESRFDVAAFQESRDLLITAREAVSTVREHLETTRQHLLSHQDGQAVETLGTAKEVFYANQDAPAHIYAQVDDVLRADINARNMLAELSEDVSWVNGSESRRATVGVGDVAITSDAMRRLEAVDYSSGNPLPALQEVRNLYDRFHSMVREVRAQEETLRRAQEELPETLEQARTAVEEAADAYAKDHRLLSSSLLDSVEELERRLDVLEVDHSDPVEALDQARDIKVKANNLSRKMRQKVRQIRAARSSSDYGSGYSSGYGNPNLTAGIIGGVIGYGLGSRNGSSGGSSGRSSGGSGGGSFGSSGGSF